MKKLWILSWVMGLALLCCGCQSESEPAEALITSDQVEIIDTYATIMLEQDQDMTLYLQTLDTVGTYLIDGSDQSFEAALGKVGETLTQFQETTCSGYTASQDMATMLEDNDIDVIDVEGQATMREIYLSGYTSTLLLLQNYLETSQMNGVMTPELEDSFLNAYVQGKSDCGFAYCGINYIFATWTSDYMPYLEEALLHQLQSYGIEDYLWQTDRDAIMLYGEVYLSQSDAILEDLEMFLGEQREALYQTQAQAAAAVRNAIPSDQADIIDAVTPLMLDQDRDMTLYLQTLDTVGIYVFDATEEHLAVALTQVETAIAQLEQTTYPSYTASQDLATLLEANDITTIDVESMATTRITNVNDFISTLEGLQFYLEGLQTDDFFAYDLGCAYLRAQAVAEIYRGFAYCGINYLFATWTSDYMPYLEAELLSNLQSIAIEDYLWQTTHEGVMLYYDVYISQMEAILTDFESFLGDQLQLLYQEQAIAANLG